VTEYRIVPSLIIITERDLEDFTRLRITFKGLTDLLQDADYSAYLEWRSVDGDEKLSGRRWRTEIKRISGIGNQMFARFIWRTKTVASNQLATADGISYDTWIGGTRPESHLNLFTTRSLATHGTFRGQPTVNLLLCGKAPGRGQIDPHHQERGIR
jgi:hypothetical protein